MNMLQEYLVLSDDNEKNEAKKSLELVRSAPGLRDDNRICIWLEER